MRSGEGADPAVGPPIARRAVSCNPSATGALSAGGPEGGQRQRTDSSLAEARRLDFWLQCCLRRPRPPGRRQRSSLRSARRRARAAGRRAATCGARYGPRSTPPTPPTPPPPPPPLPRCSHRRPVRVGSLSDADDADELTPAWPTLPAWLGHRLGLTQVFFFPRLRFFSSYLCYFPSQALDFSHIIFFLLNDQFIEPVAVYNPFLRARNTRFMLPRGTTR